MFNRQRGEMSIGHEAAGHNREIEERPQDLGGAAGRTGRRKKEEKEEKR